MNARFFVINMTDGGTQRMAGSFFERIVVAHGAPAFKRTGCSDHPGFGEQLFD